MLVLSRKLDQEVVINREIRVRLLGTSRRRVRLGIEAPQGVDIRRGELAPRNRRHGNEQSSNGQSNPAMLKAAPR
jgi:carbon storage regulator